MPQLLPSNNYTNAGSFHSKTPAILPLSRTLLAAKFTRKFNKFISIRHVARAILGDHQERNQVTYPLDSTDSDSKVDFPSRRLVHDGLVYRENFVVRSFDVDCGKKLYVHALMNYLQEVAISHFKSMGLLACGFGATPEMMKENLIWVVNSITIAIDRYPIWTDVIQIDTWKCLSGKNSLSFNWLVSDCNTGEALVRATSFNVLVNMKTRRISKLTREIREELTPFLMKTNSVIHHPTEIKKIALLQHLNDVDTSYTKVVRGIRPGCNDLDLNHHVSHIKYIDWVLESTPRFIMDMYELSAITLKYLKESNRDSVLKSVSKMVKNGREHWKDGDVVELDHFIILDCGAEAVRARTSWKRHATPNSN